MLETCKYLDWSFPLPYPPGEGTLEIAMTLHTTDKSVLSHIEQLVTEEKKLYAEKRDVGR